MKRIFWIIFLTILGFWGGWLWRGEEVKTVYTESFKSIAQRSRNQLDWNIILMEARETINDCITLPSNTLKEKKIFCDALVNRLMNIDPNTPELCSFNKPDVQNL